MPDGDGSRSAATVKAAHHGQMSVEPGQAWVSGRSIRSPSVSAIGMLSHAEVQPDPHLKCPSPLRRATCTSSG